MPVKGVLLLAFFVISLPICFVRPFYGTLLWAVVSFLNPQSALLYWSTAMSFPWAVAVAVPTLAGFLLFCRGWTRRLASREVLLILLLWGWFTLTSFVDSSMPEFRHHAEDTWQKWGFVTKVLLMVLVTIAIVDSFARLRIMVIVMALSLDFFALKALPFIVLTGGAFRLYGPERSMIADNNDLGLALNMTVPLLFFLAQTESRRWVRWFFGFSFAATIPAVFCTYSRGALLGLIAVLILIMWKSKQRLALIPVLAMGLVIALVFAPESWRHRMDPTREDAVDTSARSRLNAWNFSWRLASDYPITGGGFATFTPQLFMRYAPQAMDIHGPHSVYFGVLAEHGFVGLALYLALVAACLDKGRRLAKQARRLGDRLVTNYADMFRFSLVGFLTSGIFLGRAYFDYYYSIVACLLILSNVAAAEWAADARQAAFDADEAESDSLPAEPEAAYGGSW